ncbi:DUF2478 domain-containing protein [Methylobacterium sp. C25]|uniref:DUF2478 domain-containing protein n=1 Tax=Methylobacterium sp. C25 TaxID=2721622 RepID=UPI001F1FFCF9|nr:DUF2478 domain-containing protein [Methylobacterium sp. C25]MCE4225152.1 DUF2478 domain-containing protein [Methylobacterium sp. C25]
MIAPSKISVIVNRDGTDNQALLDSVAASWRGLGYAVVGVLAELQSEDAACSAGFLRDLVSGRRFSMALDQAPAGSSCHLDTDGVGAACMQLLPQIPASDVIVLSKFGKLEAGQQGLWEAFAEGIGHAKPLLTTVSAKHVDALKAAMPSVAWLDPDPLSLADWVNAVAPRVAA